MCSGRVKNGQNSLSASNYGNKLMPQIKVKIIGSTVSKGELSMRGEDGSANVRYLLTKAGFRPGEIAVIISESELKKLIDSIVAINMEKR